MSQTHITHLEGTRPPAVAGRFYPADPEELRQLINGFLGEVPPIMEPAPKALIAPHAGYIFSGPIAASAYARLAPGRDTIRRVVLLGPSHRAAFSGLATASVSTFATPLGSVPLDPEGLEQITSLSQVKVLDKAHTYEHALEVHLPFLQTVLSRFTLVPLLVGETEPGAISEVLDVLWGGPETCIIISSDLSHYATALVARELDTATAKAIEALAPEEVGEDRACGRLPICGLLLTARRHGLRAHTVDLRNSGDTAGSPHQVVGYGAFVFA